MLDRDSKVKICLWPGLGAQKVEKHCYRGSKERQESVNIIFLKFSKEVLFEWPFIIHFFFLIFFFYLDTRSSYKLMKHSEDALFLTFYSFFVVREYVTITKSFTKSKLFHLKWTFFCNWFRYNTILFHENKVILND